MAKYRVRVENERETGTKHPAPLKVKWSCVRLPNTHVAGGTDDIAVNADSGELYGIYEAIKHAETSGETLMRDDIEVTVQQVTLVLKRGNVASVTRSPEYYRPASSRIFDEVNARKRPLGRDV